MTDQPMDLADYIDELTRPHEHHEPFTTRRGKTWYTDHHRTRVPSLLVQLRYANASGAGEERTNSGYASRPAAPLEALDTMVRIDLEVSAWIRDLGEDDPPDTIACLRRLHGLYRSQPKATKHAIERDVRRWWTQARVVTGWDSPAWRPDNTCPMCGERGGLRVKWADKAAVCVDCRETWDQANIGLLADHIRAESDATRQPKESRGPCWCPWPHPGVGRFGICPACGSAACVHALEVSVREAKAREQARVERARRRARARGVAS